MLDLVFAVGGTGGHIQPALCLRDQLEPHLKVGLCGVGLSKHNLDREVKEIAGRGRLGFSLLKGVIQAFFYLKKHRPKLVVGFGSFHSFGVVAAARLLGIAYVLYEPNRIGGQVNRFFSKKARFIAHLYSPAGIKGDLVAVKPLIRKESIAKENAKAHFNLTSKKPLLLIYGGSLGSVKINSLMLNLAFDTQLPFQVYHLVGKNNDPIHLENAYKNNDVEARVEHYCDTMQSLLACADFAICRAGAGTLSDLIEHEIPAIMIPYPHDKDGHQKANGHYFESVVQGGWVMSDESATPLLLKKSIDLLVENEAELKENIRKYKERSEVNQLDQLILNEVRG